MASVYCACLGGRSLLDDVLEQFYEIVFGFRREDDVVGFHVLADTRRVRRDKALHEP